MVYMTSFYGFIIVALLAESPNSKLILEYIVLYAGL